VGHTWKFWDTPGTPWDTLGHIGVPHLEIWDTPGTPFLPVGHIITLFSKILRRKVDAYTNSELPDLSFPYLFGSPIEG
jgi:hypothetical protein